MLLWHSNHWTTCPKWWTQINFCCKHLFMEHQTGLEPVKNATLEVWCVANSAHWCIVKTHYLFVRCHSATSSSEDDWIRTNIPRFNRPNCCKSLCWRGVRDSNPWNTGSTVRRRRPLAQHPMTRCDFVVSHFKDTNLTMYCYTTADWLLT